MQNKKQARINIRFTGDSGDGIQVLGQQFTSAIAKAGSDLQTLPDFPAEIRAPHGTLAGVSGFQISFAEFDIHTPGDQLDILIALNPAALKANIADLKPKGILIVNQDSFKKRDLAKATYAENPLENESLSDYQLIKVSITELTLKACENFEISHAQAKQSKNMFALGLVCWLCERKLDAIINWIKEKFKNKPEIIKANTAALKAGFNYGLTMHLEHYQNHITKAELPPGNYKHLTGNEAIALGCAYVASQSDYPTLLAGYPITPASPLLEIMARYHEYGIQVFQAEDEIAAICAALGAAFSGSLGITCTSGPGFDLKSEAMGLAVCAELPLLIINVQRAGPSTGMPTKMEQTDLLAAMFGRHGESPIPIVAPKTAVDCFDVVIEAAKIAIHAMTPVIILSDAYVANSAEPWLLPDFESLPKIDFNYHESDKDFFPYQRDPNTYSRPWAIPGSKNLMHRIGGLEKQAVSGDVNYEPQNHEQMVLERAKKIALLSNTINAFEHYGKQSGDLLIITWGSVFGPALTAYESLSTQNYSIALLHLRWLNPLDEKIKPLLQKFKQVIVIEHNTGQLALLLRAKFLIDIKSFNKITGKPFLVKDIEAHCLTVIEESAA